MSKDEVLKLIQKIKGDIYNLPAGLMDGCWYMTSNRHLSICYCKLNDSDSAIHHLCESHGAGVRQTLLIQWQLSKSEEVKLNPDLLSFTSEFTGLGFDGLKQRISEMPEEWTVVQFTRQYNYEELVKVRKPETSPTITGVHLTRLPCGSRKCERPLTRLIPNSNQLVNVFWDIKKKLRDKNVNRGCITAVRKKIAADVKSLTNDLGQQFVKHWVTMLPGKLQNTSLEIEIRTQLDAILNKFNVSDSQKYYCYLIGEGCAHISDEEIETALKEVFTQSDELVNRLFSCISKIKLDNPSLVITRRHPVLLIVDEHLDHIPWEQMTVLRRHPVSRVPSIHFLHALYDVHKAHIVKGLREIPEEEVSFYVVNPDGDLDQKRLIEFLKKRLPSWVGLVGKKPTESDVIEGLTTGNAYMYNGHGSGCQYLNGVEITKLQVKPVQLLYGCSSSALKDHGWTVEMCGDVLHFILAGSGCILGFLWSVMSNDTDLISMVVANTWFSGTPVDIDSLQFTSDEKYKREPELLRVLKRARESVRSFYNGAAFIARGLPVKLVPKV